MASRPQQTSPRGLLGVILEDFGFHFAGFLNGFGVPTCLVFGGQSLPPKIVQLCPTSLQRQLPRSELAAGDVDPAVARATSPEAV